MITTKIEYKQVTELSVEDLNTLGLEGWRPGEIKHYNGNPNGDHEGWHGLMWREVPNLEGTMKAMFG